MSPQTQIEDRPAEAAQQWHPGLAKAEATAVHPQELVECPRCAELRVASGLSRKALADRAFVRTQVVFDLEHGWLASRTHARAVLRVLGEAGASVGDEADELVPNRFLPKCKTLRQKVWLKINRLATLAGVDSELIEGLEKGKGAPLTEVMAVFQVLRQHHRDVLRKDLDEGEVRLFPPDLPRPPGIGPDGQGQTDTLSQDAVQALTSSLPVALAPSDREPEPKPEHEQDEQDLPPPETMPEAETAPTVHEARLDPGNEDGQAMPNSTPVLTPDAEEGPDEPDETNRADVEPKDEPDVVEAVAAEALGPESEGNPLPDDVAATEALGPPNEEDPPTGKDPNAAAGGPDLGTAEDPAGPGADNKEAQA